MAPKKHTVRALNPDNRPQQVASQEGLEAIRSPWTRSKDSVALFSYPDQTKLVVRPLPEKKGRWFIEVYPLVDSKKSRAERDKAKILKGFIGEKLKLVRDRGQALVWTSEAEAMEIAEKAMLKIKAEGRKGNPDAEPWDLEYTELRLYIDNDYELYRKRQAIEKNLSSKMDKNKYDASLAPAAWMYLVDDGAKKYAKEFGVDIRETFPKKQVREPMATEYARDFERDQRILAKANPAKKKVKGEDWKAIAEFLTKKSKSFTLSASDVKSVAETFDWENAASDAWWSTPNSGAEVWSVLEWVNRFPKRALEDVHSHYGSEYAENPSKIKGRVLR
jgi:hypothetical protein